MASLEVTQQYDFSVAADLLAADGSNDYLVDAAGYLRATQHAIAAEHYPTSAAREATLVLRVVGDYAAQADDIALADHMFAHEGLAGKWRLYGKAAVAGTVDAHSDWLIQLESDEAQTARARSQTATAERIIAGLGIALAEYAAARSTASKAAALEQAQACKSNLWALSYRNQANDAVFEETIPPGRSDGFKATVDQLFAARGLWQEVDTSHPEYPYGGVEKGNQLTAKAAVGALTRGDRRRLRRSWELGTLLAVDALARGEDIPSYGGEDDYHDDLSGSALLAAAAPEIYVHLGLARRHQLDIMLKAGKDEKAVGTYHYMQQSGETPRLLAAALQMAPYYEQLRAVRGAREVYRRAVADRIEQVRTYTSGIDWKTEHPKEAAAMQPIMRELGYEVYKLDDPVDKLLATVEQLSVAVEVDPVSQEATSALGQLRECWDVLELMESYNELLPKVADTLKAHGIGFVREWKRFPSYNGYVGYGLVDPRITDAADESEGTDRSFFIPLRRLEYLRNAARALNELHGEGRFVLEVLPETRAGSDDHEHETEQRVRITGSWRKRGLRYGELFSAEGATGRTEKSLDTLPSMTDRLMALHLADEAAA